MNPRRGSDEVAHIAARLRRLFTRKIDGWGERTDPRAAISLAPFIAAGRLTLKMRHLPLHACVAGAEAIAGTGSRESIEHLRIKRAACAWMWSVGAVDAEEEIRGYGGRFDVYSSWADWIVEAGNSDIAKLVNAIRDDERPRFTLIPYQAVSRSDGSPRRLIAVDFVWDEAVTRDLSEAIHHRMRASMAEVDRTMRDRMIAEAQARKAARES